MTTTGILLLVGIITSISAGLIGISAVILGARSERRRNGGRYEW